MTYNFPATQNNGRIVSSSDGLTGENVSYTYDSLNRLIAAASTGVQWNESYSYDGFGNMTGKTSTKGTPANPQVDSNTNRARMINDYGFDANGNWLGVPGPLTNLVNTWNVENQLVSNGLLDSSGNPFTYTYDPAGKRVLQYSVNASYGPWGTLYFYSITGQRLATYHLYYVTGTPTTLTTSLYFGGRLLAPVDRLGSVRKNGNGQIAYFPWGEEESPTTPDGTDKYATYFRDGTTNGAGQDYANARYYNNNFGRFWSVDPGGIKTAHAANPASWNRYSYVNGDPVNKWDPRGLDGVCGPYGTWMGEGCYDYVNGPSWDINQAYYQYVTRLADTVGWVAGEDPVAILQAAAQNFGPPDPNCVQDAISAAAVGVGLNLSSFTNIGVQIVGTQDPNGGTYGETELNLSGGDVQGLINAMCAAGFDSNGQCSSNNTWLVGTPHTAPDGTPFTGNFRSPSLTNSIQVNTNVQTGQVQIDVDPYNPAAYPILGAILHGVLQVLPNKLTGGDNTYGCSH